MRLSLTDTRQLGMTYSSVVVEILDGRRRAAATATSLAEARRRAADAAVIGVSG